MSEFLTNHRNDDDPTFFGAQFDVGLAWVHFPPGHGGLGFQPNLQELVDAELEAVGRRGTWLRNPMGIGMVGPTIAAHGTEDQRRRYLRPIFTAEEIWCQLFSEPGAGSDVASLATRAVRDGDGWVLNGQKVWTSLADVARWGLVLARTDPEVPKHAGLTAFIIDMHARGVEIRPLRQMTGDAHFSEVFFADARVSDSARVGNVGEGWRVAITTLMNERVSIGGSVEPRNSGPVANLISVWKSGLRRDPYHRDAMMRVWIDAEVLRLGNLRAQALRDRGAPGPEGSVLKLGNALVQQRIYDLGVRLLGATGMLFEGTGALSENNGIVREFLQAQSSTIAGGTSEMMRNILGERVLGLPAEPRVDHNVPWNLIAKSG